jgi:hypothetical protein
MPRSVPDRRRSAIVLSAFLVASCATAERAVAPAPGGGDGRAAVAAAAPPSVRFSEIHYDNASTDVGEAIELSGPAGTSLAGWSVVLYNGNGGAAYNTRALTATIPATCGDRGVVVLTYPQDGIQNGSPDGMALVDGNGQVVEFLSYEGTFTAVGGPANGMVSTDIGVSQAGNTPAGRSLGRTAAGTWNAEGPATFGACNDAEGGGPPVGPLDRLTVTPATATVTVGATVNATALAEDAEGDDVTAGTIAWTDEGSDIVTVTPSADGRSAAVRGDAPGGPARVIATLTLDGVTRADTVLVTVNAATPPGGTTRIVFSGFNDAPLPPGFEDQLFATAFSGPSNADALPAMTFTWRALTPEVATIDAAPCSRPARPTASPRRRSSTCARRSTRRRRCTRTTSSSARRWTPRPATSSASPTPSSCRRTTATAGSRTGWPTTSRPRTAGPPSGATASRPTRRSPATSRASRPTTTRAAATRAATS